MSILRDVDINESIGHALWEAHACIGLWAFCAGLAMLRKALDLWSGVYRDRHDMTFDKSKGERDDLYWRLRKITEENKLYRDSIHTIIDGLRLTANNAVHDSTVCSGGHAGNYDAYDIMMIRSSFEKLHNTVVSLITTTLPEVKVVYSDTSRWHRKPPK